MGDDVMISVDPHKASNTLAVMDPVTKTVIARQRFANTAVGVSPATGVRRRLDASALGGGGLPWRGPSIGAAAGR